MKNTKTLRNIFIGVGVLFALVQRLTVGATDHVLEYGETPLPVPIITFDAPEAGTGPQQGTIALAINDLGTIAGHYFDSHPITHGFVRAKDGTISKFDAPDGGTGPYQGTFTWGMNSVGAVTGSVRDSSDVFRGYVRAPDGTFSRFDVSGAGTLQFQGTIPSDINLAGLIAGYWIDPSNVYHGFLRAPDPDGTITSFDVLGAGTGPGQGTAIGTVDNLNSAGDISGNSIDANNVYHGYLRLADGNIDVFDVPGAGTGPNQGTQCGGINDTGWIVGGYIDTNNVYHGF